MATTAKRVKDAQESRTKFSSRKHNRCKICGRPRAYLRKFGICRLCFRGLALMERFQGFRSRPGKSSAAFGRMNGLAAKIAARCIQTSPQVLRPAYEGRSKRAT